MKYNRRTSLDKQEYLSDEAKIASILEFGTLKEKILLIRSNSTLSKKVFNERIKNSISLTMTSKNFLKHLITIIH